MLQSTAFLDRQSPRCAPRFVVVLGAIATAAWLLTVLWPSSAAPLPTHNAETVPTNDASKAALGAPTRAPKRLPHSSDAAGRGDAAATDTLAPPLALKPLRAGCDATVGTRPPTDAHFAQVMTYVGPVPPRDIAAAMADFVAAAASRKAADAAAVGAFAAAAAENASGVGTGNTGSVPRRLRLTFVALDGTLMNLLRWGRVVNDNDVDVGFYFSDAANAGSVDPLPVSVLSVEGQYYAVARWLTAAGLVDAERKERRIRDRHRVVKPGRCKFRGRQLLQCRHRNGVIFDLFGPDVLFSSLTGLAPRDVAPPRACRAFSATFPCPARPVAALKQFTMDISATPGDAPVAMRDFAGCALFPRKATERTSRHVRSILASVRALEACGYPSLLSDTADPECQPVLAAAGILPSGASAP